MCEGHYEADCGCHHGGLGHGVHGHPYACCCGEEGGAQAFRRRFRGRDERVAEMEAYLRDLEAEAQGVREEIKRLRPQ